MVSYFLSVFKAQIASLFAVEANRLWCLQSLALSHSSHKVPLLRMQVQVHGEYSKQCRKPECTQVHCLCGCIRGKLGPEEDQFLTPASLVVHQASGLNFPTCKARWVSACFRMTPFCAPASSGPTPGCPLPSQVPQPLRASVYLHQCFSARLCSIHSQNRRAGRARSPC